MSAWFLFSTSARTEAKLLSFFDFLISSIWLSLFTTLIYLLHNHPQMLQEFVDETPGRFQDIEKLLKSGTIMRSIIISSFLLRPAVSFILAIMLFIGAQRNCYLLVRMCLIFSIFYIIVDLILLIPRTIYLQYGGFFIFVYMINFAYMMYEWRVVFHLMSNLQKNIGSDDDDDAKDSEEQNTDDTEVVESNEGEEAEGGEQEEATPKADEEEGGGDT